MSDSERLEKLIESNAKSIQALNNTVSDAIRQLTAQIAESNRFSTERMDRLTDTVAETNRQMAEHSARTNSAISEIAAYFGTLARVVHDHETDDERHN